MWRVDNAAYMVQFTQKKILWFVNNAIFTISAFVKKKKNPEVVFWSNLNLKLSHLFAKLKTLFAVQAPWIHWAPSSKGLPSNATVLIRPPRLFLASRTQIPLTPWSTRWTAADKPANPPPMMITLKWVSAVSAVIRLIFRTEGANIFREFQWPNQVIHMIVVSTISSSCFHSNKAAVLFTTFLNQYCQLLQKVLFSSNQFAVKSLFSRIFFK